MKVSEYLNNTVIKKVRGKYYIALLDKALTKRYETIEKAVEEYQADQNKQSSQADTANHQSGMERVKRNAADKSSKSVKSSQGNRRKVKTKIDSLQK